MSAMPEMTDKEFWHRHLHLGMYPAIRIAPALDFAVQEQEKNHAMYGRWNYSLQSFLREKRELRFGTDPDKTKPRPRNDL